MNEVLAWIQKHKNRLFSVLILTLLTLFLLSYFDLRYLLLNTTPTGGDTPAHNYLAKHLKETFFNRGAIISWAKGWWCGFPMYQYYFFLPYFAMALLSFIIPFNIAFKIISILGILFLPLGVYFSLKWMDFEDPIPLLGSIAMLPYLFVNTHTMWGVNIYSTLAGEISNSISFVFFVLFLGSFYQDMKEIKFRLRSVILFVLLLYTHFFTSIIAAGVAFFLLFLFGKDNFLKRLSVYLKTNLLTFLLAAWWIIPLLFKSNYSMEFGGNWDIALWKTFPLYALALIPLALYALYFGIKNKKRNIIFILLLLIISLIAFYIGGSINASFTNIRFWPFIFYASIILAAIGTGYAIADLKASHFFVAALAITMIMAIGTSRNDARSWVKWNYEGLEKKADYATFRDLVLPLDNTPGRLANDLHEFNNHFGSTRVFETVPALINKAILEGGIVNSATGSMFSYYIQGETSINCAGFPTVVNPATFNMENATKHLKLANVKHFVAYWEKTRKALLEHPEWKLLKTRNPYQLFELTSNRGNYVYIPQYRPMPVKTKDWKENAMEWIYSINAIDQPFILAYNSRTTPTDIACLTEEQYLSYLASLSSNKDEIPVWQTLGPYYFSSSLSDEQAADTDFIDIKKLNPQTGSKQFGRTWKAILRQGPIFADNLYQPKNFFVSYNYANIISEKDQPALLHYSNDDHCRIYLNDELVVRSSITGFNNYKQVLIRLRKGKNHLLYKLEQSVGGAFFHAKITGLNNQPLNNIYFSIFSAPYKLEAKKTMANLNSSIKEIEVSDQKIRFSTKALGEPHIIKYSYFPNWKVIGADKIYHVTPNFMLVYPNQEEVTLYYGSLPEDILGRVLSYAGFIIFATLLFLRLIKRENIYH